MNPIRLGLNVDHVATVRQARGGVHPDPVEAALQAEEAGADSIVCHLREDRRHIQDRDVAELRRKVRTRLNLEMGLAPEIVRIALKIRPDQVTLVPEKRLELTTEGGLDAAGQVARIRRAVGQFGGRGIEVSLFLDPDPRQLDAASRTGATIIEIHTGHYANASRRAAGLRKIAETALAARRAGFSVAAGHGLTEANVRPIAAVPEIEELNIGHSIVSRALFTGLGNAVRRMKDVMNEARSR